ncbi:protein of unknown function [endosymbiont DhMRE of Dentiscutata heterogama]|uniref:hypothetical protein n=1 Tax=endosymbiont DhMRE of Dentiscutata heterogama TaxID=1609546 RepID=UPI000629D34E|nr:hypothetical protein [endosymbiont DhMRE of Dentiscutata heterogama]CFW92789.1 protein of unknown function [endosymbiont DhMRE of Dentiscutata heterogama]
MTEIIKITAKEDGTENVYIGDYRQGLSINCRRFISQETDNGEPKYKILIPYEHPELEKQEKIDVNIRVNNRHFEKGYCYEISFVDSKDLLYKSPSGQVSDENKNKRVFNLRASITIKDNSYEKISEQLKNENNLMKEEETTWKGFIEWFRGELAGISDKNSIKYQEGRKFVEDLEAEFNKKTGKGNDDPNRERERERETKKLRNYGERLPS